ncbi:MAG: cytochrome c [Acidobacteria bacterium]|nr:cytochrome c [Acidobacteriota bacterium]
MEKKFFVFLAVPFWVYLQAAPISFAADKPGNVQKGVEVHKKQCLRCHGAEGKGDGPASRLLKVKPADWRDPARMSSLSDEDLYRLVKEGGAAAGKSKMMPAFGAKLNDQEIYDVIAFVKSLHSKAK